MSFFPPVWGRTPPSLTRDTAWRDGGPDMLSDSQLSLECSLPMSGADISIPPSSLCSSKSPLSLGHWQRPH